MSDGIEKNLDQVKKGFYAFKEEAELQTALVRQAFKSCRYRRVFHHLTGYRAAAQEHMWKLWFYTFWPKWALVAWLILR